VPLFWLVAGAGVGYLLLFAYGLRIANSGQGAVLGPGAMSLNVAWITLLATGERAARQQIIGIAIVLVGVLTILLHDVLSQATHITGFLLIFMASSLWAAHTVASRILALNPLATTAIVSVLNALLVLPMLLVESVRAHLFQASWHSVMIQIVFQGILAAIVALILYAYAIRRIGANNTAVFTPLAPVLTALIGYLLLGDVIDLATGIGLACVVLGVIIGARTKIAPEKKAAA
jgi:drug/metabolite transporter (DMT)-like permease